MSTYQEKLEQASLKASKKIFDNNVRILGNEVEMLRLRVTYDKYEDAQDITLIKDTPITVVLDLPVDIPLNRFRPNSSGTNIDKESIFLFDIIPIFIYVKWFPEDDATITNGNLEKGDYLVYIIKDSGVKIPIVFRVAESLGSVRKNLIHKKYQIAPYNGQLTSEIETKILAYISAS